MNIILYFLAEKQEIHKHKLRILEYYRNFLSGVKNMYSKIFFFLKEEHINFYGVIFSYVYS